MSSCCSEGTFANQVERKCATYESKAIVWVQGLTAEASKQPFAEVKLFDEAAKASACEIKKGII